MKTIHTIKDLQAELQACRDMNKTIGLVPTMGALHAGHISLVEKSVTQNDITVVSVFVNPTQFNNANDLLTYPRTFVADSELLAQNGVDILFAPSDDEMYPEPDTRQFDYSPLDTVMEGRFRPGHFNGVCQVVSKLFSIVNPTRAYFGEKDFQQLAIIRKMASDLFPQLTIVGCPIMRESDGLALSSRNARLSLEERIEALTISKTLMDSVEFGRTHTLAETIEFVTEGIAANPALTLEYFELVDGYSLQQIANWEDTHYAVGCITVYCGKNEVRLIDNITYLKN